jgi:elongation factor G
MLTPPWPLVEVVIQPSSDGQAEALRAALRRLTTEDRNLTARSNPHSPDITLCGASELQLDIAIDKLRRDHRLRIDAGAAKVAYRAILTRGADVDHTYKRQTGGSGEFARVSIRFAPADPGTGYAFKSEVRDRQLPRAYVLAIERGLYLAKEAGLLAGVPVIDFTATLASGAHHDLDSSVSAFDSAAQEAFEHLRQLAAPTLVEPITRFEIQADEGQWRRIVGWLEGRRIKAKVEARGDHQVVSALAPLANTLGLWRMLTGCSVRLDAFSIEFDHYAPTRALGDDGPDGFPSAVALRA